jgi:hypothetical protein
MKKKKNNKDKEDMGKWSLPTRWSEVTLGQFAELEKLYNGDASKGVDTVDLIAVMSSRTRDEVMTLPLEFMETMMVHLVFLETQPEIEGATDRVEIDGETYIINYKEKLKFGEYVDFDQLMKSNPNDYPSMFAIICRKEGEAYDSEYISSEFQKRVEMFSRQPVTKMLPLIAFFLRRYQILEQCSQASLGIKEAINLTLDNIQTFVQSGVGTGLRSYLLTRKLKKLRKYLKCI